VEPHGTGFNVTNSTGAIKYTANVTGFGTGFSNVTSGNITHVAGETYTARIVAKQNQVGYVNATKTVTWENLRTLEGYPDWVGQWLGVLVLVILAGSVSVISTKYMLVILQR